MSWLIKRGALRKKVSDLIKWTKTIIILIKRRRRGVVDSSNKKIFDSSFDYSKKYNLFILVFKNDLNY